MVVFGRPEQLSEFAHTLGTLGFKIRPFTRNLGFIFDLNCCNSPYAGLDHSAIRRLQLVQNAEFKLPHFIFLLIGSISLLELILISYCLFLNLCIGPPPIYQSF